MYRGTRTNVSQIRGAFHVAELVLELDFCILNQISKHREITNFCNPSKKIHRISAIIKDSGTKPWFSYVEYSTYEIQGFSLNSLIFLQDRPIFNIPSKKFHRISTIIIQLLISPTNSKYKSNRL